MDSNQKAWPASRIVHLPGGCLASNYSDSPVIFLPESLTGGSVEYEISEYHELAKLFCDLNMTVIGVDYFQSQQEIDGIVPPVWKALNLIDGKFCSINDLADVWSNIGHSAYIKKDGRLWDISSRISHQLNVCSWRLSELSTKYQQQLKARTLQGKFKIGQLFIDLNTWHVYLSIQAFLVDACVLRDYLAEFVNYFVVSQKYNLDLSITSMGGLLKGINKIEIDDLVLTYIKESAAPRGWLKKLGEYRDLVVHSAPLAKAEQKLFVVSSELDIGTQYKLPSIICPIPDNPKEIAASRSKGNFFENFEKQIGLFNKAANMDIPSTDGLVYAHSVVGNLYKFAHMLVDESPVIPKRMTFDESNIISDIEIKYE